MNTMTPLSIQTTILLFSAVSFPLCEAFTPSFSNQQLPTRISKSALDVSSTGNWYSTLAEEPELWTKPEDRTGFRKVMEPGDSNRVMNQIDIPGSINQQQPAPGDDDEEPLSTIGQLQQEVTSSKRKVRANVRETGYDSMRSYIKTMCNHELLNKNEEVVLAREIQRLMQWEEKRESLEEQLLRYVMHKSSTRRVNTFCKNAAKLTTCLLN